MSGFEGVGSIFDDGVPKEIARWAPDVAEGPAVGLPPESAGWSWEQWQRFVGISMTREQQEVMDRLLLGTGLRVSWERAEELYERIQAEERRASAEAWAREARLYWTGRPDELQRQILRAYGLTARDLGLLRRSAFSPEYRRRQRNRVKRRRR